MGNPTAPLSQADARHLLRRSGFGARSKDLQRILSTYPTRGQAADWLLRFKVSGFKPGGRYIENRVSHWIDQMLTTVYPLREKLVLFWHDHFSTSNNKVDDPVLMGNQNRLLRKFCRGNFKDFVKAINTDPAMMDFLDTVDNVKDEPNENYARELQELFTLGASDYNGQRNYEQEDVVQIARAFSGWNFNSRNVAQFGTDAHDYTADYPERGPKVIYKLHGGFTPNWNGPAGVDYTHAPYEPSGEGAAEIDGVIEAIFTHKDSDGHSTVARYLAGKLFTFFAQPYPKRPAQMTQAQRDTLKPIIDELIADSSFDTAWDLGALVRAIFVNDNFYATEVAADPQNGFGATALKSVKWPVDFVVSTLRVLNMRLAGRSAYVAGGDYADIGDQLDSMGQVLFEPPSVFGWNWEASWINSATLLARCQFAVDVISARGRSAAGLHPTKLVSVSLTDPAAIVTAVADVLGIADQLTAADQQALIDYLTDGGTVSSLDLTDSDTRNRKLNGLFGLILQSPAYQLH